MKIRPYCCHHHRFGVGNGADGELQIPINQPGFNQPEIETLGNGEDAGEDEEKEKEEHEHKQTGDGVV